MAMTPPPVGWSMNDERGRRVFAAWLKEQQRTAQIQAAAILIGSLGLIAMFAMYSWAILMQQPPTP